MDASASTAWGKASSPIAGKNKGFLSLEDEGISPFKSRSFKDVLSGNDSIGELPTLAQSVFNGVPAVLLSDEEVLKLASPFQFTLVGKFSLRQPNLDMIRQFFGNLKLTGFFSIGLLDDRHISIQLTNDLDYSRVFARRSYFVNNCQMRILKWTPFFDIRQESPIVPIWISFPNLRLHFFNPEVLHALGSLFGRPLQTDQATAARTRPSVARVLVEVDITKKHAKEVWVGSKAYGYLQKVDFENIPDFCSHCKMHGHASTVCFKLHPGLKNAPKPTEEEDVPSSEIGLPAVNIDNSDQVRNVEQTPPHVVQGIASAPDSECVKLNVPVSNDIAPASITVPIDIEKSNEFFISIDSMLQNNASNGPTVMNESQSLASNPPTNVGKVLQTEVGDSREEGEFIPNESGDRETSIDNLKVSSPNTIFKNMTEDPQNKKNNDEVPFTMGKILKILYPPLLELPELKLHQLVAMIKALISNVRGIGGVASKARVHNLCRIHDIQILVLMEPMISTDNLVKTAARLGFSMSFANCSNKIWIMWNSNINLNIIADFQQVVHVQISCFNFLCHASFVYALCTRTGRLPLWKQLQDFATIVMGPWCVGGDFNGGNPPNINAMNDFSSLIFDCNLHDIGVVGGGFFTWNRALIWQRLDRILFNNNWIDEFNMTKVEHLSRTISDHAPLLLSVNTFKNQSSPTAFRFQNMWLLHDDFMNIVQRNWVAPVFPNNNVSGMSRLWSKLSRLKQVLRWWNKNTFKNIFSNIKEAESLVRICGFNSNNLPIKYLGTPLYKGRKKNQLFDEIFTACQKKISSWYSNFLSFGGRLVLIKSVLNSIPIFILHTLHPSATGAKNNNSCICWTSWNKICGDHKEGGLGCKNFADTVNAFSYKLWFSFRAKESLWARFMHAKYCKNRHPLMCHYKVSDSMNWKRLCNIKWEADQFIQWGLGCGNVSFWQDNWLGVGSIDCILNTNTISNIKVHNFFENGSWNMDKLLGMIPMELINMIVNIPLQLQCKDTMFFNTSPTGKFSLKSVWNHIREKFPVSLLYSSIWNKNIPLSYSVLAWRVIKNFLPVDNLMWNKGFSFPSKCQCCANIEDINHVFAHGECAYKVWNHFFGLANLDNNSVQNGILAILNCWFNTSKGHILNIIPVLILWYLWQARNDAKHNDIKIDSSLVILKVKHKILSLYAVNLISVNNFKHCLQLAGKLGIFFDNIAVNHQDKIVKWCKPSYPFVKLNSDGSVGNSGAGFGGIVRNHLGDFLFAYAGKADTSNVLTAELLGLLYGLISCSERGFLNINIEVDAINLIQIFNRKDSMGNPGNFYTIRRINQLLISVNYTLSHIYREGNACADFFAKMGSQMVGFHLFSEANLPFIAKGIITLDKAGLPYIRIR
ncbi:hypothetical protein M5K25_026985 [Dendrobium thyrsiflorum]|uniref:RNase H type-1 domain-containing protein n=1 Tax=Dendrobium thyrsiflorum TaxID=117978 RepID=A0ABD0TYU7_DENTH